MTREGSCLVTTPQLLLLFTAAVCLGIFTLNNTRFYSRGAPADSMMELDTENMSLSDTSGNCHCTLAYTTQVVVGAGDSEHQHQRGDKKRSSSSFAKPSVSCSCDCTSACPLLEAEALEQATLIKTLLSERDKSKKEAEQVLRERDNSKKDVEKLLKEQEQAREAAEREREQARADAEREKEQWRKDVEKLQREREECEKKDQQLVRERDELKKDVENLSSQRQEVKQDAKGLLREALEELKKPREEKVCPEPGPWHAQGKTWHRPAKFPRCSMDACFNYSRCDQNADSELLIYSDFPDFPPTMFFQKIKESKYHTDDPEKACLFFVFLPGWAMDTMPPHPNTLPFWNGGMNHVLVNFADKWFQTGPYENSIGLASIMASDMQETLYRPGFDISIPLPANHHFPDLQSVASLERKYFATFKGMRYLSGPVGEEGTLRSQDAFRNMHNGEDIIVLTSCQHPITASIKREHPELGIHCDEDEETYAKYDYIDLMNTTFAIVPAGIQASSYRFIEVLSAGAVPVLIADNYVKPFEKLIQWHKCLLQFPSSEMHRIVQVLRGLSPTEILQRQENCLYFYREFLQDDATLIRSAVRSSKVRFMGSVPMITEELLPTRS
ncbi:hypothetical protein BDL97_09G069200 [Sphagnum fallax]|jgi:glucuronyl/N-acetylglucosaminyl transferase EXT1|nr:hypothetical protein BDL97_09G069200 [Sphagnum fallax]